MLIFFEAELRKNQDFCLCLSMEDAHILAINTPDRLCQLLKRALGKATVALIVV